MKEIKDGVFRIPSGIGDAIWCLQTLDTKYRYNIETAATSANDHGNKLARRAHPLKELFPTLIENIITGKHKYGVNGAGCNYQVNTHLERGKRIETFSKHFIQKLPWSLYSFDMYASQLLNDNAEIHIGIYSSATVNVNNWNGWGVAEWVTFARKLNATYGKDNIHFYCIGAEYDDTTEEIHRRLPNSTLVQNYHLGVTVALIEKLDNIFAFASGIPIIASTFSKKTMMFYPKGRRDLKLLSRSFPPLNDLKKGIHRPKIWSTVDSVVKEVINDNWI